MGDEGGNPGLLFLNRIQNFGDMLVSVKELFGVKWGGIFMGGDFFDFVAGWVGFTDFAFGL
jgi:hypothetical protein